MRILVIDNDPKSIDAIQLTFELGWPEAQILKAETGREGIDLVELEYPTAIVLGLGLTDVSGFEVLRQIRRFSGLPILVLLPNNEENAIVKVFTWGANGCLIKPFRQMEFLARIRSLSRNVRNTRSQNSFDYGKTRMGNNDNKPDHSYKNTLKTLERDKHIVGQCPKCASILVYQEGSFTCPICGFSKS